jgi:thiosulfate reductase/polysulfide reductase chain A
MTTKKVYSICGMCTVRCPIGGLDIWDPAGGGVAMQEHFVTVRKAG